MFDPRSEKDLLLHKKLATIHRDAEERDAKRRAETLGYPYVDIGKTPIAIEAVALIPEQEAHDAKAAALQKHSHEVALAVYDPNIPETKKLIDSFHAQKQTVKLFIASLSGLEQVWHFYSFVTSEGKEITGKVEMGRERLAELSKRLTTFKAVQDEIKNLDFGKVTTTGFFEIVIAGAMANRASDIHFEPGEINARLRYRVDGILHDVATTVPTKNYNTLTSRIKLLSGLKINVYGEPQDGRFTIRLEDKDVEIRVSFIPSEFGETIVMRVLDPDAISVDMDALGLRKDDYALVEAELAKPHGLILNTGPTGSGKTTTLYAFLQKLVNPEIKIITVEDPIEYRIAGIEQTQVDPDVGYTFAGGLRAIVRQDPDVILVGEIRDAETADIALQASLTGHMVFSTIHTNDAVGTVPRLINLGAKPSSVGPAVSLIIAQRLVRRLCDHCKKEDALPEAMKPKVKNFLKLLPSRVDQRPYEHPKLFKSAGCEMCNGFGFKGRKGIFEFFKGGEELERLILTEVSEIALRELARKQAMVTMQQDGILKVLVGETTFAEVEEATGPIAWQ